MNKEQFRQYLAAFSVFLTVFLIFSLYLFLRRGYFNLFIANKVLASTALVLLGIILLIGPLSRFYNRFDKWMVLRREIGIFAFLSALGHAIISFSPTESPAIRWGWFSLAILILLFGISFEKIINQIRRPFWVQVQSWGLRIGTFLVFLHLFFLKYPGWIKWLKIGGSQDLARPDLPPASLLGGLFIGFIAVVRLGEIFGTKLARKIFETSFIGLILSFIFLFLLPLFGK